MIYYRLRLIFLMLLLVPLGAEAQYAISRHFWQLCTQDPLAEEVTTDTGAKPEDSPIQFTADTAQSSEGKAILTGDVKLERGDQRLRASEVTLDRVANQVEAKGGVVFGDPNMAVRSSEAGLNIETQTGWFEEAEYYLPDRNAQGSAKRMETDRSTRKSRLKKVTYSTCERGAELWQLRSRRIDIDENRGRGSARHVTLALKGTPILYFPYISFPLNDERQSGFLVPRVGYDSKAGADIQIPYYWNIAPNRDMTITPRIMSRRGVMLGTEYRFLNRRDRGLIQVDYLPHDQRTGGDRGSFYLEHQADPIPRLYTDMLFQYVSDDDYVEDFDNSLRLLSDTYLVRRLDARYYGDTWSAFARVQSFQTLDDVVFEGDEPYNPLPHLFFQGAWPQRSTGLRYEMRGELIRFDRNNGVRGTRLDVQPGISWPLRWPAGFVTPRLSYRATAYKLHKASATGSGRSPSRNAPVISLDSGMFFERPVQWKWWWNEPGLLTLEPQLFYLYVPRRNQSDLPLFDTTNVDLSYAWLFLENRFTGADRLGDANQLTTALTSRLLRSEDGRERMRFSVGQIQYFANRKVTLSGEPQLSNRSRLIAESLLNLSPSLSLRGSLQWDTERKSTQRSVVDLRYRPGGGRLLNFSHRFAQDQLQQLDFSLYWPISARWQTMARWNYSLEDKQHVDAFAGFQYDSCCWSARMLVRNHRKEPEDSLDTSFYFELELKGLAGIGTSIDKLLEEAIVGYQ